VSAWGRVGVGAGGAGERIGVGRIGVGERRGASLPIVLVLVIVLDLRLSRPNGGNQPLIVGFTRGSGRVRLRPNRGFPGVSPCDVTPNVNRPNRSRYPAV
jgi:hypothetical protein